MMQLVLDIEGHKVEITCKANQAFIIEQAVSAPKPKQVRKPQLKDMADAMKAARNYAIKHKCTVNVRDFYAEI